MAVSVDGGHVYVTGEVEDALAVFARDDATGALTYLELLRDDINGLDGLDGATGVQVSFDDRFVYVGGYFDDSLTVFDRDGITGELISGRSTATASAPRRSCPGGRARHQR